jgi:murein L,D-transpeptidase YcbB/YkuD
VLLLSGSVPALGQEAAPASTILSPARTAETAGSSQGYAPPAVPAGPAPQESAAALPAPAVPPKVVAKKPPAPAPLPEPKISQDPRPSYHAGSAGMIQHAAAVYAGIVVRGGWPSLPSVTLKPGVSDMAVITLRERLAAEGEDGGDIGNPVYDPALVAAVKRTQDRYGLPATGLVGPATVNALNVPAEVRQRSLAASAQRLSETAFGFGPRHVVVNIPSAAVEAVDNGVVTRRYVAIAGDPKHPSPTVEARIGAVNFNPTWTVPVSIIKKELIPKMRLDPGYLAKSQIRMLDATGAVVDPAAIDWSTEKAVNYTFRQDSGSANALGAVRIAMPNSQSVYMHDTPSKRLFGKDFRFLSHGCVRVAGVLDLATWLLQPQGWTRVQVDAAVASPEREDVRLPQPVPVAWVYLTGFVTGDGVVHFRDDVYGLDTAPQPEPDIATATIAPSQDAQRLR